MGPVQFEKRRGRGGRKTIKKKRIPSAGKAEERMHGAWILLIYKYYQLYYTGNFGYSQINIM